MVIAPQFVAVSRLNHPVPASVLDFIGDVDAIVDASPPRRATFDRGIIAAKNRIDRAMPWQQNLERENGSLFARKVMRSFAAVRDEFPQRPQIESARP